MCIRWIRNGINKAFEIININFLGPIKVSDLEIKLKSKKLTWWIESPIFTLSDMILGASDCPLWNPKINGPNFSFSLVTHLRF